MLIAAFVVFSSLQILHFMKLLQFLACLLGDDWVVDPLDLHLSKLVAVEPHGGLVALLGDLLVVDVGLHVETVAFESAFGRDFVLVILSCSQPEPPLRLERVIVSLGLASFC